MCLEQQWEINGDQVFIANQEDHIKSKNITEKITFESMISIYFASLVNFDSFIHSCRGSFIIPLIT